MKTEKLNALDYCLKQIAKSTNWLPLFTPLNLAQERDLFLKKFQARARSEPNFVYRLPDGREIERQWAILENTSLDVVPRPLRADYENRLAELIDLLDMVRAFARGNDAAMMKHAESVFGRIDDSLLARAKETLRNGVQLSRHKLGDAEDKIAADQLAETIRERLQTYGAEWQLTVTPETVARISVDMEERLIRIRSDASFVSRDIDKILVHEIDTHVLRAQNGLNWNSGIFAFGFSGCEGVDEGLALLNERRLGVASSDSEHLVALHVLGIDYAMRHSFSETFDWVLHYIPEDFKYAFDRVVRWKRGLHEQDRPGAFSKDLVYFKGAEDVARFFRNGGKIQTLYYGRISLCHTDAEWETIAEEFLKERSGFPVLPLFVCT